ETLLPPSTPGVGEATFGRSLEALCARTGSAKEQLRSARERSTILCHDRTCCRTCRGSGFPAATFDARTAQAAGSGRGPAPVAAHHRSLAPSRRAAGVHQRFPFELSAHSVRRRPVTTRTAPELRCRDQAARHCWRLTRADRLGGVSSAGLECRHLRPRTPP